MHPPTVFPVASNPAQRAPDPRTGVERRPTAP